MASKTRSILFALGFTTLGATAGVTAGAVAGPHRGGPGGSGMKFAHAMAGLDLTAERVYSLDLATRALLYRLDKPLLAKVYFTKGLQAPYNNHEQILVDKLEDFRAYSKGLMDIEIADPSGVKELTEEAQRFGIEPIQYRYRSSQVTELKQVAFAG